MRDCPCGQAKVGLRLAASSREEQEVYPFSLRVLFVMEAGKVK